VSERDRRFFAGNSLAQVVAAAARYFGVEPERLAYRVRPKRHGFLKVRRPVVIEVDPGAPRRAEVDPTATVPHAAGPPRSERAPRPRAPREDGPRVPRSRPAREPRPAAPAGEAGSAPAAEAWGAADEDAALAAGEAARRLLQLAGLRLEPRTELAGERLEIELHGADEGRLRELGLEFLEDFEHLLPRAAHGLCGRLVRMRVEGAGLRAAREAELRALARAVAERVVACGREELLEALDPGERRIVHLELQGRDDVATESVGTGFLKRLRVSPR